MNKIYKKLSFICERKMKSSKWHRRRNKFYSNQIERFKNSREIGFYKSFRLIVDEG